MEGADMPVPICSTLVPGRIGNGDPGPKPFLNLHRISSLYCYSNNKI
jgi:hypothetical protein